MKKTCALTILVLAAASGLPGARAQEARGLPSGADVLERYVEATGGRAAYEKFTSRVSTGTIEIVGANIKGKIVFTQAAPGRILNLTDIPGVGKSVQGTDGRVAWEDTTIGGRRVLQGEEAETFRSGALFNAEIRWKDQYVKAQCLGIEDVAGKPAYKVELTRAFGKPVIAYYDVKSHLLTRQTVINSISMGEMKIDVYPVDYRKIDGVLMPLGARQTLLGQEFLVSFTDVKHNVALSPESFSPPKSLAERPGKASK